jgi:hypothetical protein
MSNGMGNGGNGVVFGEECVVLGSWFLVLGSWFFVDLLEIQYSAGHDKKGGVIFRLLLPRTKN